MFAFQIQFVYLIKLDKYGLLSQQINDNLFTETNI